jgi:tryptophanyl-tRNA synthetase
MRTRFQQNGDRDAIEQAKAVLDEVQHLSMADRERLFGYLEGTGKMILVEPGYLLTEASKMPGLDGQKMSKSYNNTITLRESEESVAKKIKSMPTDTNRVRRTDPGGALPGLAIASGLFRRCMQGMGAAGLQDGRHRLYRMQAAGHRRHPA